MAAKSNFCAVVREFVIGDTICDEFELRVVFPTWHARPRMASDPSQRGAPGGTRTYSVHPAVAGRSVLVRADLDGARAFCDG